MESYTGDGENDPTTADKDEPFKRSESDTHLGTSILEDTTLENDKYNHHFSINKLKSKRPLMKSRSLPLRPPPGVATHRCIQYRYCTTNLYCLLISYKYK